MPGDTVENVRKVSITRRPGVRIGAAAVIVIAIGIGIWYWVTAGRESTDDAQIDAHVTQVSARVGGTIVKVASGSAWSLNSAGLIFAVGSLAFSWLFLRGRMIPLALASLGVIASALLVVFLPLQIAGIFAGAADWSSRITWIVWMPMLAFEVPLALWLMIRGVRPVSAAS